MYKNETWVLRENLNQLRIFQRKILRKIRGPYYDRGEWRLLYDKGQYHLFGTPDIIRDIEIVRLRFVGHVQRMKDNKNN